MDLCFESYIWQEKDDFFLNFWDEALLLSSSLLLGYSDWQATEEGWRAQHLRHDNSNKDEDNSLCVNKEQEK